MDKVFALASMRTLFNSGDGRLNNPQRERHVDLVIIGDLKTSRRREII